MPPAYSAKVPMVTVILLFQRVGKFRLVQVGVLVDPVISAPCRFPFDGGWSGSETHHRRFVPALVKFVPLSTPSNHSIVAYAPDSLQDRGNAVRYVTIMRHHGR